MERKHIKVCIQMKCLQANNVDHTEAGLFLKCVKYWMSAAGAQDGFLVKKR